MFGSLDASCSVNISLQTDQASLRLAADANALLDGHLHALVRNTTDPVRPMAAVVLLDPLHARFLDRDPDRVSLAAGIPMMTRLRNRSAGEDCQ